jgi:uncharacterized membrane protein
MSDTQRSSVALRTLIVGGVGAPFDAEDPDNSLAGLNTAILPDGAEAYVISTKSTYRLDKESSEVTVGDTFVQAEAGGGTWVKQDGGADFAASVQGTATLTASAGVIPLLNTWRVTPSAASFYAALPETSPFWAVDTSTGVLTYSGPAGKKFLFMMTASMNDDNSGVPQQLEWDLTAGGALISTTTQTQSAVSGEVSGTVGFNTEYTHVAIVTTTDDQFYQYVFRCVTVNPGTMSLKRYQVSVIEL